MNRRLVRKQDKDAVIHGLNTAIVALTVQNDQLKALVELLVKEHQMFNPFAVKVDKT